MKEESKDSSEYDMESGLLLKSNDFSEGLIRNFPDPYHYIVGFSCH